MTDTEKLEINELRNQGLGYKAIAKKLSISENTVKSYCRRHKVGIKLPISNFSSEKLHFCKCCGAAIEQRKGVKPRKFCSDSCRKQYWTEHQGEINRKSAIEQVCPVCGKAFSDYANHSRKFCSHNCYIRSRFKGGDANG